MNGPYLAGTHYNPAPPWGWEESCLSRGDRYRVIKPYIDADGDQHVVGEEWTFLTSMFSRFDLLTLCVRRASDEEWRIPMLWTPEAQQVVIEGFSNYVARISSEGG